MTIKDEFQFIDKIKQTKNRQPQLVEGIGDDAALYKAKPDYLEIVCADTMAEGVHFLKDVSSPVDIGYKALAVNISDVAAMGGVPKYYLVTIAVPKNWSEEELVEIYAGMDEIASFYSMDLIGGDTVSTSDKLVITVTVIGEVQRDKQRLRKDARPGDSVFVTGTIGDSAAGLQILLGNLSVDEDNASAFLVNRHKRPMPQVKAAQLMSFAERISLNDISDGLASELNELCEASCVKMIIEKDRVPLSDSLRSLNFEQLDEWILYGGEDFELVGTVPPSAFDLLQKKCTDEGISLTKIGHVEAGPSEVLLIHNGKQTKLKKSGFNHFK
ncbi:thiamine-phosphate kinase [Metabacillus dongyingensis]|uniref:thiamine-phosphate kinase n=1 Tax=Metabacillus dongyingensis TaxID=2874282 RepID=UPI001CBB4D4C|nr:thiamine-phosphate kinase [Metabacillus dongyingensis]UAL52558.1 thiamine-phosphate kinase [Metabacillus dongyingensis]